MWLYGQGFPKAADVGVMIDKAKGAEREVVGTKLGQPGYSLADNGRTNEVYGDLHNPGGRVRRHGPGHGIGEAVDRLGQRAQAGLGAHRPGDEAAGRHAGPQCRSVGRGRHEHRRQPDRDVRQHDVLATGGGRSTTGRQPCWRSWARTFQAVDRSGMTSATVWPLAGKPALGRRGRGPLDQQTGTLKSGMMKAGQQRNRSKGGGATTATFPTRPPSRAPTGTPAARARFFYVAKAAKKERNPAQGPKNDHPTVKPLKLMEYLLTLLSTPTGGVVLDPFAGSGSTLLAAKQLGRPCIGIELDEHNCEIAAARLDSL